MQTRKPEIEQKVLSVAREAFLKDGYEKVALRRIAKEAGITVGNLYHYFKSKDDLYMTIFLEFNRKRLAWVFDRMSAGKTPLEELRLYGKAQMEYIRQHPDEFRFAMYYDHHGINEEGISREVLEAFDRQKKPYIERFRAIFERGKADGSIRGDFETSMLIPWVTMTLRLILNEVVVLGYYNDEFYQRFVDFLMGAIQEHGQGKEEG